ncbi:MAG: hypothetical protein N2115_07115 [bacterium]|nr:hypothetical protein [bacterium]
MERTSEMKMDVIKNHLEFIISSEYWKVKHSRKNGGTVSSIVLRYGSDKNLLVEPFTLLLIVKEGNKYNRYRALKFSPPI